MAEKNNSKAAKFFCENCGAEVPQNAKMCRHCGRFFSSVRCPQCGLTGSSDRFSAGCPGCGYAFGTPSKNQKVQKEKNASRSSRKALKKQINERHDAIYGRDSVRGDESLPWWIYIFVAVSLFGMCALFIKLLG